MATIAEALDGGTLMWAPVGGRRPGMELRSGSQAVAFVGEHEVEIDGVTHHLSEFADGHWVLREATRDSRVATLREVATPSRPATISAGAGRYRLTRRGVLPFFWQLTEDIGGPQLLQFLKFGSRVLMRTGDDLKGHDPREVAIAAVLAGIRLGGLLEPTQPMRHSSEAASET